MHTLMFYTKVDRFKWHGLIGRVILDDPDDSIDWNVGKGLRDPGCRPKDL